MDTEKILEGFGRDSQQRKQKINRADVYRARPEVLGALEFARRHEADGRKAIEKHAPFFNQVKAAVSDETNISYRDQELVRLCREFDSSCGAFALIQQGYEWLETMHDSLFDTLPYVGQPLGHVFNELDKKLNVFFQPSVRGSIEMIRGWIETRINDIERARKAGMIAAPRQAQPVAPLPTQEGPAVVSKFNVFGSFNRDG